MKYTNIKKLLIKFMGGGLINFPTRFLRWIKIDGDAEGDDGDSGSGGGGESSEFVLRFKKENFFNYIDEYSMEHIANVGDEFTLDEIFEMSDNTIVNMIDTVKQMHNIVEEHNSSSPQRTWYDSYENSIIIPIEQISTPYMNDEYGIFAKVKIYIYDGPIKLEVEGTNLGNGSIGTPKVIFDIQENGKYKISYICDAN